MTAAAIGGGIAIGLLVGFVVGIGPLAFRAFGAIVGTVSIIVAYHYSSSRQSTTFMVAYSVAFLVGLCARETSTLWRERRDGQEPTIRASRADRGG